MHYGLCSPPSPAVKVKEHGQETRTEPRATCVRHNAVWWSKSKRAARAAPSFLPAGETRHWSILPSAAPASTAPTDTSADAAAGRERARREARQQWHRRGCAPASAGSRQLGWLFNGVVVPCPAPPNDACTEEPTRSAGGRKVVRTKATSKRRAQGSRDRPASTQPTLRATPPGGCLRGAR